MPTRSGNAAASLQQWLQRTPALLGLQEQALASRRMGEELSSALPRELLAGVRPGRYAEAAWSLHASSPAVAAKLKLFVPLLLRRLQAAGWPLTRIQVRVSPPDASLALRAPAAPTLVGTPAPQAVRERLRALRERHRS